jgi:regulator of protease activity HflC (stomatin/prohibitin superfamily)
METTMLWTHTTIQDFELGMRHRNGRLVALVDPGRHRLWFPNKGTRDEVIDLRGGVQSSSPELEALVSEDRATRLVVGFQELAIVRIDGLPTSMLRPGRYLLWQERAEVTAEVFSTAALTTSIPETLWSLVPADLLKQVVVQTHERVVLLVDGVQTAVLEAGRYGLHAEGRTVANISVDMREQEVQIGGQEVMTADKVTLRVNLVARFRVTDAAKQFTAVVDVDDAIYTEVQLASRRRVATTRLDDLLEKRNQVSDLMFGDVAPRLAEWGVELVSLGLKDTVLPGEMKTILNQVIQAEKQAAASVILRREETAATRSLANTAKLLEQNPTLLRLKELESMERMAAQVGELTVVTSADALAAKMALRR